MQKRLYLLLLVYYKDITQDQRRGRGTRGWVGTGDSSGLPYVPWVPPLRSSIILKFRGFGGGVFSVDMID